MDPQWDEATCAERTAVSLAQSPGMVITEAVNHAGRTPASHRWLLPGPLGELPRSWSQAGLGCKLIPDPS